MTIKIGKLLATFAAVVTAGGLLFYILRSYANPHFWEILVVAILLPVAIGYLGLLISRWHKRAKIVPLCGREQAELTVVLLSILGLIGTFIFVTNRPKLLRLDVPIVYAVNCQTHLPPRTVRFDSQEVSHAYRTMRSILGEFQADSKENAELVSGLSSVGPVNTNFDAISMITDLTAYLVPYYLSNIVTTPELQDVMYRGEGGKWGAVPHTAISGENKRLDQIDGDFRANLFYGYRGQMPLGESGMRLPSNTDLHASRDSKYTSSLYIQNDYVTIKIGADTAIFDSGQLASIDPGSFEPAWLFGQSDYANVIEKERKSRYHIVKVTIRFDAEFDRWRYGFSDMKYHEQWVHDLFALLERKFSWGSVSHTHIWDLQLNEVNDLEECT